jgi:hypothetical protein
MTLPDDPFVEQHEEHGEIVGGDEICALRDGLRDAALGPGAGEALTAAIGALTPTEGFGLLWFYVIADLDSWERVERLLMRRGVAR